MLFNLKPITKYTKKKINFYFIFIQKYMNFYKFSHFKTIKLFFNVKIKLKTPLLNMLQKQADSIYLLKNIKI